MDESYLEESVRTRLILAGIGELEEHGMKGFSLRRAAMSAQVSCAAPYRHFKDKEEYIAEIVRYIASRWQLMYREIESAFSTDVRRLVIEASIANVRFWLANPNYRSVLTMKSDESVNKKVFRELDGYLLEKVDEYCKRYGRDDADVKRFTVLTMIYGTVMLVGAGELSDSTETLALVRKKLEKEFPDG